MLVQDYHFALLPRMVKEARPDARVAIFWHIPWPNPEAFGICPVAARIAGRHAGRGPDRLPHSGALQQLPGNRGPGPGVARGGITFLRKLMAQRPMPVVMCSSLTEDGSETLMQALEAGAVDVILKPRVDTAQFLQEARMRICDAVKAAARLGCGGCRVSDGAARRRAGSRSCPPT